MKPLVRGAILEGLGNAGKTSVLRALKQQQANDENAERSVVILGEHYSQQLQNMHNELVSLECTEHITLLQERVECIEQLNNWAMKLGPHRRRSRGLFYVLERFHLNHRHAYGESDKLIELEHRLSERGGVCFLLTVSPDHIRERLLSRDAPVLQGKDLNKTCDDWLLAQEKMLRASEKSQLPTVIINTDAKDWAVYASKILDVTERR